MHVDIRYIQSVLCARNALKDTSFGTDTVKRVASRVVSNGRNGAVAGWPLMWVWHDKAYVGHISTFFPHNLMADLG